jgi:hypothetical protein
VERRENGKSWPSGGYLARKDELLCERKIILVLYAALSGKLN